MTAIKKTDFPGYISCNGCKWLGSSFRASCPDCGSIDLQRKESSGRGRIVDFVPVLYPPDNLKDLGRYVSVLIQFDEGFRMFGITMANPEDLSIGVSVVVSGWDKDSQTLFVDKA